MLNHFNTDYLYNYIELQWIISLSAFIYLIQFITALDISLVYVSCKYVILEIYFYKFILQLDLKDIGERHLADGISKNKVTQVSENY